MLLVTIILISCKKEMAETNSPGYYFKAKFNGVEKNFSIYPTATKNGSAEVFTLAIGGSLGNESNAISLWSKDESFTTGQVFGIEALDGEANNSYGYSSDQASHDPTTNWGSVCVFGNVTEKFECKLTEVTSSFVKGTFSADIYKNQPGSLHKIEVTDGEFFVQLR